MSYVILEHSQQMTRRTFLLGAGKTVLMLGLVGRIYQLQILESHRYQTLSDENRIAFRLIPAPRGRILDRWGKALVSNENSFQVVLLAEKAPDLEEAIRSLQTFIDLSETDTEQLLQNLSQKSSSLVPLLIKDQLSWEEVSAIETNREVLPGVVVEVGQQRRYLYDDAIAHLIGYVGYPSKQEAAQYKSSKIPGFYLGKAGVEKVCNDALQGLEGSRSVEINARRQVVRDLGYQAPKIGRDLSLSLDHRLQLYAAQRLQEFPSAATAVLNAKTGEILAFVSSPSFNPNLFVRGISKTVWKDVTENPYNPLLNKVMSGLYAPGSTLKMLVALAALSEEAILPTQRISCTGYSTVHNHRFHCWAHKTGGHGPVNVYEALMCSCDVFFYETGRRLGIERLLPFLQAFGLGQRFFEDFPGEKAGLLPSPAWKREHRKARWTVSDTLLTSIGQGMILSTPLQLAVMAARLATGTMVSPSYLLTREQPSKIFPDIPLKILPEHMELVRNGMIGAVNDPRGTAYNWRIPYAHAEMAGKTGTSQVRRISLEDRKAGRTKTTHLPWHEREHALFCGYAPLHDPRYSIAVLIEHGGSGGSVATPVARDILWMAQKLEKEKALDL
ncbi:MAG: penicillin-binding protein 2 [Alphaproteobacteria bacterium]